MNKIVIEETRNTPAVDFDFFANVYSIRGESFPDNVATFYSDIIESLELHLSEMNEGGVKFDFHFVYFNSSTGKVLIHLFDILEDAAERGIAVTVNWLFDEDDDTRRTWGEEFAEDLEAVQFYMQSIADD